LEMDCNTIGIYVWFGLFCFYDCLSDFEINP
jgi:hypothetical protein